LQWSSINYRTYYLARRHAMEFLEFSHQLQIKIIASQTRSWNAAHSRHTSMNTQTRVNYNI